MAKNPKDPKKTRSGLICLFIVVALFVCLGYIMGATNMLNTMMNTAHDLLLNTCFFLMAVCVLMGAISKLFIDFGVADLLERLLRPLMKPLFNLPGVSSIGAVLTFLSDNPAIITLAKNKGFGRYFKKYQLVSLTNFGTSFGMGIIVIVFLIGQGFSYEPFIGLVGAFIGAIVSTRIMQYLTVKAYPELEFESAFEGNVQESEEETQQQEGAAHESLFIRILNSLLDGGKGGVEVGMAIIPGVLIISTLVMMLTFGASTSGAYTGAAYEGTALLPWVFSKINFIFDWLFGFSDPHLVAFPITALGAVGAALGVVPRFISEGWVDGNAIAVFTAIGMCWSGFLSTHTAMLDSLGYRKLVSKAIGAHTIGGLCAGISAHLLYIGIVAIGTLFAPKPVWEAESTAFRCNIEQTAPVTVGELPDGTIRLENWYGEGGEALEISVNPADSSVNILNSYKVYNEEYFYVKINPRANQGQPAYAALYPLNRYSEFVGDSTTGHFYIFAFIYNKDKEMIDRGYYEIIWGNDQRMKEEDQEEIRKEIEEEKSRPNAQVQN